MNTALALDGSEVEDFNDVRSILLEIGVAIERINPRNNTNYFVWSKNSNEMVYISSADSGYTVLSHSQEFPKGTVIENTDSVRNDLWIPINNKTEIEAIDNFSYYVCGNISNVEFKQSLLVAKLDYIQSVEGSGDGQYIPESYLTNGKYTGVNSDSLPAEINGKIGNLTVDAPTATVHNYAAIDKVTINAVNSSSYHEFGTVNEFIVDTEAKANIQFESSAVVQKLTVTNATSDTTIKSADNAFVGKVENTANLGTVPAETDEYKIGSYQELMEFSNSVNSGFDFDDITVTLTANIDLTGKAWTPIGNGLRDFVKETAAFAGTFDGGNFTITGLSNKGYVPELVRKDAGSHKTEGLSAHFGLFGMTNNATIKNIKMENVNISDSYCKAGYSIESVGAIVGFAYGNLTIENVTTSGNIAGDDAIGGILGRIYGYEY